MNTKQKLEEELSKVRQQLHMFVRTILARPGLRKKVHSARPVLIANELIYTEADTYMHVRELSEADLEHYLNLRLRKQKLEETLATL